MTDGQVAGYYLVAQDDEQGPIAIQTGTEQEIREACRVARRNLMTHGVGGYYAASIRDFMVGVPPPKPQVRTAEEANVADALMAQLGLL